MTQRSACPWGLTKRTIPHSTRLERSLPSAFLRSKSTIPHPTRLERNAPLGNNEMSDPLEKRPVPCPPHLYLDFSTFYSIPKLPAKTSHNPNDWSPPPTLQRCTLHLIVLANTFSTGPIQHLVHITLNVPILGNPSHITCLPFSSQLPSQSTHACTKRLQAI